MASLIFEIVDHWRRAAAALPLEKAQPDRVFKRTVKALHYRDFYRCNQAGMSTKSPLINLRKLVRWSNAQVPENKRIYQFLVSPRALSQISWRELYERSNHSESLPGPSDFNRCKYQLIKCVIQRISIIGFTL